MHIDSIFSILRFFGGIMLDIVMPELKSVARDFYNTTGTKIALYDADRTLLYTYPETATPFCSMIRQCEALMSDCLHCDHAGFDMAEKKRQPHLYKCHMGMTEASVPIYENDTLIGYLMICQILCESDRDKVEQKAADTAQSFSLPAEPLLSALRGHKIVSDDFIRSALNMMTMCVCYLHSTKIIKSNRRDLTLILKDYAEKHFAEPVSVPDLCRQLYISKSKLYQLSKKAFGMGISDYVRLRRLQEAKTLLTTTAHSVTRISRAVGFSDSNYFTRIFRQAEGCSPSEYRAAMSPKDTAPQ